MAPKQLKLTPEEMYLEMLRGGTLKTVGQMAGGSSMTVLRRLKAQGYDVSKTGLSLARSVTSDHGTQSDAFTLAMAEAGGMHRSEHNMNQLSKFQCAHDPSRLEYLLEQDPQDQAYDEPMSLKMFNEVAAKWALILANAIAQAIVANAVAQFQADQS